LLSIVFFFILEDMSKTKYTPEELALLGDDMDLDNSGEKSVVRQRERTQSSSTASGEDQALPRAYYNVRAARAAATTVRTLGGCVVANNSCGTFLVANDNRVFAANH
jgi:hypothetical protein